MAITSANRLLTISIFFNAFVVGGVLMGFEMLGMPQRDITAESAAERLRSLSATHFTRR